MLLDNITVLIPLVAVRALDITDAPLGEPPGQQALPPEVTRHVPVETVELLCFLGFFLHLKGLRRLSLHAERKLEGLNACFQVGVALADLGVAAIDALQPIELEPL